MTSSTPTWYRLALQPYDRWTNTSIVPINDGDREIACGALVPPFLLLSLQSSCTAAHAVPVPVVQALAWRNPNPIKYSGSSSNRGYTYIRRLTAKVTAIYGRDRNSAYLGGDLTAGSLCPSAPLETCKCYSIRRPHVFRTAPLPTDGDFSEQLTNNIDAV